MSEIIQSSRKERVSGDNSGYFLLAPLKHVVTPHLNRLNKTVHEGSQHIDLMRNRNNYPSIIIKYSSYLELRIFSKGVCKPSNPVNRPTSVCVATHSLICMFLVCFTSCVTSD